MSGRFSVGLFVAGMSAATALLFAGPAGAATTVNCPGGDLQGAINSAGFNETITIYGTCYGNFVVPGKTLTLQGGSAGATLNGTGSGTTLTINSSQRVTIRNLTITNGSFDDGGGIRASDSNVTMVNSTVKLNQAGFGGGIFAEFSNLDLTGVTVTRNVAALEGGGIDLEASDLTTTASTISLNRTTQSELIGGGGGIRMEESNAVLTSTKVTTNTSARFGGGIADYGLCPPNLTPPAGPNPQQEIVCLNTTTGTATGRSVAEQSQVDLLPTGLTLVNSSVDHNITADDGGGIYNETRLGDSPVTLQGTTVSFNNAKNGDGGGIANYGVCGWTASLLATGSTFQGNVAKNGDGGAVYNATGGIQICVFVDASGTGLGRAVPPLESTALVTVAQSGVANGPNVVNSNQARHGAGFANEQDPFGVASLTLQTGAKVTGNKASITGGGVWNDCGSFSSLGQIMLNSPNNVVNVCLPPN